MNGAGLEVHLFFRSPIRHYPFACAIMTCNGYERLHGSRATRAPQMRRVFRSFLDCRFLPHRGNGPAFRTAALDFTGRIFFFRLFNPLFLIHSAATPASSSGLVLR